MVRFCMFVCLFVCLFVCVPVAVNFVIMHTELCNL